MSNTKITARDLAASIVPYLDGFTLEPDTNGNGSQFARLVHADGRSFHFYVATYGKHVAEIRGDYPGDRNDSPLRYNETAPSINVSATREPKAIAADIMRRFMPAYVELLAKYREAVSKRESAEASRKAACEKLAAMLDVEYRESTKYGADLRGEVPISSQSNSWGAFKADYRGESFTLELHHISPELAADIAEVITLEKTR
jgi:hypothetical protein